MESLGRLEEVGLREVWADEARDFTPWLLDHGKVLADALGIDIEMEEAEHAVGGYSLDLLGRDLTNDAVLIVENQLDASDHTHLGQILTYAAGTDASTIVWVAGGFREEHRQAVDWINERTDEDTRLFAVRLGLRRIGDSAPAPLFDVVSSPNDWQKQVRAAARSSQLSGKRQRYHTFWEKFLARLNVVHQDWTRARATPSNAITMASPIKGAYLNPLFSEGGRIAQHLWIDAGDAERNHGIFKMLEQQRPLIEEVYGAELDWDWKEDRKACKIAEYGSGRVEEEDRHDEFIEWFIDAGERFRRALEAAEIPVSMLR
jgi:hypothetical protein